MGKKHTLPKGQQHKNLKRKNLKGTNNKMTLKAQYTLNTYDDKVNQYSNN